MELLKRMAAGLAGAFLAILLLIGVASAQPQTETPLPPCPTEDSDNCYWDADTMGNNRGHDVVTITPMPEELP